METKQIFIDGKWVNSVSGETFVTVDPANGEPTAWIQRGNQEDINRAVKAARNAFEQDAWRDILPAERGRILLRMAQLIREKKDDLAKLETRDAGKPLSQSYADVEVAARYCEYYGGVADKILGETIPVRPDILDYTIREPMGVTAHIVPWNYPIQIATRSLAPALATGNTAVIKPAEDTPLTALCLAEIAQEAGVPDGVVNVVTGFGQEAGAALAKHPDIDQITFTGSVPTGIAVMKMAAENVKPITLELGGKSPNIVFADADLSEAADWVVRSIIQNGGQTCSAGSRLLVEKSVEKQFVELIVERMKRLRIGPGLEDPDLAAIVSEKQLNRIESYMQVARDENVTTVTGGYRVTGGSLSKGYFFAPTVFSNVRPDSRLAQEEVFGPVLVVIPFESVQEAVSLANHTEYGLVTAVWTTDINKAHFVASRVRSGQVFINNYGAGGGIEMPFGGYKKSGFGREKGLEALKHYTQLKNIALRIKP
ncbi:aldehyde dehydrogenase family protein [Alicyclobacillus fastidiosus]|uniref:Aldehyde dehydrogenase family protein n=1 Tax=Alicyclobacillus fastidiosus TaxID=392011 RepID=A0ABY6ZPS2_9BACL|nr:aldehyde dehydrogenase family protein [Alicyclobacillus fastidiosus]WAH44084.1 aldehyde dehydrogenase family protein [Alicyclobacillus fastidiosus]GMA60377.1 aldehyde dehydrogenase [Alicyclobacillus fastidiosus]